MSGLGCGFNRVDAWLLPDSGTEMSVDLSAANLDSRPEATIRQIKKPRRGAGVKRPGQPFSSKQHLGSESEEYDRGWDNLVMLAILHRNFYDQSFSGQ
jgi:hypothetical protein